MNTDYVMKPIAHIRSAYPEKFGIPRQSGLVDTKATITFVPDYAQEDAVRGLEGFSHLWLIWCFSENADAPWHATVRPPRLGGNTRVGVFASRSPFRPNPIGLSCVKLEKIEILPGKGPILTVRGADLLDGTPILDIKPYLRYSDAHPEASGGFADANRDYFLDVQIPDQLLSKLSEPDRKPLYEILRQDPRPSYQDDPDRVYGIRFSKWNIHFTVKNMTATVIEIKEIN